jgi:hypothetical protein
MYTIVIYHEMQCIIFEGKNYLCCINYSINRLCCTIGHKGWYISNIKLQPILDVRNDYESLC